jgi:hypothetical protein
VYLNHTVLIITTSDCFRPNVQSLFVNNYLAFCLFMIATSSPQVSYVTSKYCSPVYYIISSGIYLLLAILLFYYFLRTKTTETIARQPNIQHRVPIYERHGDPTSPIIGHGSSDNRTPKRRTVSYARMATSSTEVPDLSSPPPSIRSTAIEAPFTTI